MFVKRIVGIDGISIKILVMMETGIILMDVIDSVIRSLDGPALEEIETTNLFVLRFVEMESI